jgi:hypothetical protein
MEKNDIERLITLPREEMEDGIRYLSNSDKADVTAHVIGKSVDGILSRQDLRNAALRILNKINGRDQ